MAVDGVKFLVQLRKLAIRTIITSTRSVRNHPFLVAAFLFVIFLYRSSPFLFSLLVSASPVLVCTAVLLGTLLSFGQGQIPEIEWDEKISCEISSLRAVSALNSTTVLQKEAVVFDRDDPDKDVCSVSRFGEGNLTPQNSEEIDFEQRCVEEANAEYKSREVEFTKGSGEEMLAFEGRGFENERSAEGSVDGHMDDHFESESHEVTLTFEGTPSSYEVQEKGFENDGSGEGSDDGHVDDHDHAESSSVPWTRVNGDHGGNDDDDEDEDEDEASNSGSDGAESSSPDPSMADIIPLLDELHPLIECANSIPANLSRENSDLLSDRFHSSHVSSINSDEETDHKEAEEEEDGDDDDEAENRGDKEDSEKPAITWTEDDQKNLMDLGTSELERNLRLESLIARRKSRRSMKMTTERNLIDLDDFDLPFQVAPISTTRQNPFDFPNDTFDNMGLPPIPGSAPSRLMPRRNPFDLPYDSGEEKPDLMADSFQQEFMHLNQKEQVFRRNESFHIGSSSFEFPRQDPRDLNRASRFRPYFIPESSFMRQSSGSESSSFQRQISELSGSSSFHRQTSGISEASSFQRQSSDVSESKASSAAETEPVSAEVDREETMLGDHDSTEETVPDPEIDRASEHVEHGSQSSDNLDDKFEKRDFDFNIPEIRLGESETFTGTEFHQPEQGHSVEITLGSIGNERDVDSWVSEARDLAASAGIIEGDMHLMASPAEDKHFSSSSSLSSEEHDDVEEADKGLDKGEEIGYHFVEKPDAQAERLFEASEFHHHQNLHLQSAERSPFETNLTLETIQEEHIISSGSSLASEEHNITEGLKFDETLLNMQHIRPDVDKNSDFPTKQALDSSNFSFSTDVEESHPKEPVYDLSPQTSRISLSISSEELADLQSKGLVQERDGFLLKNDGDTDSRVHVEDPILSVIEERHADADADAEHFSSAQADLFVTANVVTEEPILGNEDVLLSDENSFYSANLVDVPGNYEGKLISVAEEDDSLKDHCLIPPNDYEEESFVNPEKLEEVSSVNRLHSEDSEMNDLLNLSLQTVGTSSGAQELGPGPVNDFFDFGEPVEGRTGFEFESTVVGDFDGTSQFCGSFVPEVIMSDEMKELEEALLSELDAVGDFRVTELGMDLTEKTLGIEEASGVTVPEAMFINKSELEAEKVEAGTDVLPDSHMQESTAWFQALEPESIEKIEQPIDENDEKPAPEAIFINTFESNVQDAETGMVEFLESHVLESRTIFHVPEPETSQNFENSSDENAEIFGTIESIHLQDELLVGGTEVGPMEDFESAIRTDEQITFDGNISAEGEIERFAVAAVDVSSGSHVSESNTVIEKTEPGTKINELAPAMEEEIERPAVAATDVSSDPRVLESNTAIEEDEPAAEINESAPSMEEELERSAVAPIDTLTCSHVLESHAMIEEDELAAEMNKSAPAVEVIDVLPDTHVSERNTVIEEDEPAAEMNESTPVVEEEIERSAVEAIGMLSESRVSESYTVIEEDEPAAEMNESAPAVEEEIERTAAEAIEVLSESRISERNSVVEDEPAEEMNETAPTMEEEIERSAVEVIDVLSESRVSKSNTVIEEDEPAAEMNESAPAVEKEIETSAVEAIDVLAGSHVSESNTVIEKDESAAEMNESSPAVEEEIERPTAEVVDVLSDSHVSESNIVIEKDEPAAEMNESAPAVEEEIEGSIVDAIDVLSDSHVSESNTLIEKDKSAPAVEEVIERSTVEVIDVLSDSHVSESNTVIDKDELAAEINESAPAVEEDIERSAVSAIHAPHSDSHVLKNDTRIEDGSAMETNEPAPAVEEKIEGSGDADIDASSDFHVSNSDTVIEKDEPAIGDKGKDASEIGNHQAESSPERPTSAQVSSSLQLESAESQALHKEDHQMAKHNFL